MKRSFALGLIALVALAVGVNIASAYQVGGDCQQGTVTPGQVSISFSADGTSATANPTGFSQCGGAVNGYAYSWSPSGSTSKTTATTPGQAVQVYVWGCSSDPDYGCAAGPSASASGTAPNPGGPPPPGGGGNGGGTGSSNDSDGDGVLNGVDNCPTVKNPTQHDADGNGVGDACQTVFVPISGTVGFADDQTSDPSFPLCPPGTLARCTSDASAQPNERCQLIHDYTHAVVPGINWTVFHQRIDFTACWIPGSHFTRIKGTPVVVDLTCGTVCTYPYQTTLKSGPGFNFKDYQTLTMTVQWDFKVCPVLIGLGCAGDSPTFTVTHYIYGEPPGVPAATGTLTQSVFQQSHSLTWGG